MTGCHIEQKNQPGNCKMGQDTDAEQPIQVQHAAQEHDGWWSRCLQERVTLAS